MHKIALKTCPDYEKAGKAFVEAVELLGGPEKYLRPGKPLIIKPNLLAAHAPEKCVTTHPAIVEAAIKLALDCGAKPVLGESPGLGSLQRVAKACGILDVCAKYDVPLLDFVNCKTGVYKGGVFKSVELAEDAVNEGLMWNLPKWKTHTMMGLTLGVKNLYGCVQGKKKVAFHFKAGNNPKMFAQFLLDIWQIVQPALTVVDGVLAMDGAGPSRGQPIRRGLILASEHAPSLDYVAAKLSGFNPMSIPTIELASENKLFDPNNIEIVGDSGQPVKFRPAPGSPTDFFNLPEFFRVFVRSALSPTPVVSKKKCVGCFVCVEACPANALTRQKPPVLNAQACIRCYCCQELCPEGAIYVPGLVKRILKIK